MELKMSVTIKTTGNAYTKYKNWKDILPIMRVVMMKAKMATSQPTLSDIYAIARRL